MKLAAFGVLVVIAGFIAGIDGLLLSGAVWIGTGLLIRALVQRNEGGKYTVEAASEVEIGRVEASKDQAPRVGLAGAFLLLLCGLGSIAIGIFSVGFPDDQEVLRWFPFAVGALITLLGLTSVAVELGRGGDEVAESGDKRPKRLM